MSGAIPLFPLYAFMAWTGTNLPLPFPSLLPPQQNILHCVATLFDFHPETGYPFRRFPSVFSALLSRGFQAVRGLNGR